MNDKKRLEQIRDRPGMYGLNGTYHSTAMLVLGFDLGRSGDLLDGFTEWLVVRKGEPSSLVWFALVFQEALPGGSLQNMAHMDPHQDQQAVDRLFELLLQFLELREDEEALALIHERYKSLNALDGQEG
ncbi:hypothetical protein PV394_07360 [Streptomyces sp. NE06-03E]|uniref:hypothetical protein n=1 Tax=unclassified Streptomyces TaxID=2593676 RepID=UPI0029A3DC26|nr:hypothetical protein [Streptomyces sp. NE06-03E]MDX3054954.1 hypothetical protein [Streptomyces sp. NE06-03E]